MMASGTGDNPPVVANDGDDGQTDDSKFDKKKKKGAFQKIRNFFGGSSKKRFKPEGSVKSLSIGALNQKQADGDDDDDGGFIRQGGLGSRSISEDSVFKQEPKESSIAMLHGHAVSMEHINKFHSQALSKVNQASSNQESDQSFSLDRTYDEESLKVRKMSSSLPSLDVQVDDFEVVMRSRQTSLSNEAAKHRISVKPKSRRMSTKMSMKKRDTSPAPLQLADVQEESPPKVAPEPIDSAVVTSVPHKTVISTTIPVGPQVEPLNNTIPTSELHNYMTRSMFVTPTESSLPTDIPRSQGMDDLERSRPRSMSPLSPLSSSPVSMAMLQEVKLKSARPAFEKPAAENVQNEMPENNELAKAFSRAKRISKKFDEGGILDVEAQKTEIKPVEKVKEVKLDIQTSSEKPVPTSSSSDNQKDEKLSSDKTNTGSTSPVTGVSYVLKKEPLRAGSRNGPSAQNVGKETSDPVKMEAASSLSVTTINVAADEKINEPGMVHIGTTNAHTSPASVTINVKTVTLPNNNKLASPRDEYRLKRQARSKTLPASKELMDKKETDSGIVSINRKSADLENTIINATGHSKSSEHDYTNIKSVSKDLSYYENIGNVKKEIENPKSSNRASDYENFQLNKHSSWASGSVTTGSASSQPEWVTKAQKIERKMPEDIVEQPRPKEIKIDPVKSEDKKDSPKSPEVQTITEKAGSNKPDGVVKPDSTEKQGSVSLARTNFGKVSASPTKAITVAASSELPQPSGSGIGKPPMGSASRFVSPASSKLAATEAPKPAAFSQRKTSIGSSAKPFQSEKPTFQSVKPPTAVNVKPSIPAEKPVIPAAKPTVSASPGTANKFGSFSKPIDKHDAGTKPVPAKSNVAKADVKDTQVESSTEKKNVLTPQSSFEKKNVLTPQTTNISNNSGPVNKVGSLYKEKGTSNSENNASSIPRKFGGSVKKTPEMNIEIIDTSPNTSKLEQKSANVPLKDKPKATVEKCSDGAGNRPKVLDMVKSFQKLQVT